MVRHMPSVRYEVPGSVLSTLKVGGRERTKGVPPLTSVPSLSLFSWGLVTSPKAQRFKTQASPISQKGSVGGQLLGTCEDLSLL